MSELWRLFFDYIWIIIIIIVIFAIFFSFRRKSVIKEIFENLAIKRNGTVSGRLWALNLSFIHDDHVINLSTYPGSRYQSPYTRTITSLNIGNTQRVKIYVESWVSELGKKIGLQDIPIGSSEFDDKFIIKGSDEMYVINLLTIYVQDKLLSLRKHKPIVNLDNNQIMVSVPKQLKTEEDYDLLIETTILLIDRIKEL